VSSQEDLLTDIDAYAFTSVSGVFSDGWLGMLHVLKYGPSSEMKLFVLP
jgi:hypothetical protein